MSQQQVSRSPARKSRSPRKTNDRTVDGISELDPEFRRTLARELYVDETVNVVNSSKKSQVKPGQMNLFNPKG